MGVSGKIKVGIVGGAGYTAGELIRILLYHPEVVLKYVQSGSNNGKALSSIHTDLLGECSMIFTDIVLEDTDLLFLCPGSTQPAVHRRKTRTRLRRARAKRASERANMRGKRLKRG